MKMFAVLLFCSVLAVQNVYGNGRGAPACVSIPRHAGIAAQKSASPYATSLKQSEDGSWKLTIGSNVGKSYKGILLQANQSGNLSPSDRRMFNTVSLNCNNLPSYTHSSRWSKADAADRKVSEWTFTSEEGSTQKPSFKVIILESYTKFWTDIQV